MGQKALGCSLRSFGNRSDGFRPSVLRTHFLPIGADAGVWWKEVAHDCPASAEAALSALQRYEIGAVPGTPANGTPSGPGVREWRGCHQPQRL